MSWVSQLVRIASFSSFATRSTSCLGSNSESERSVEFVVVVVFRWRVSCAHQTADWTTCMRSYKNWTLTSWWKEGKKTKVYQKKKNNNAQLLVAPSSLSFLSELTETVLNVGGPNLYAVHLGMFLNCFVNVLCRRTDFTVGHHLSWPPCFSSFQICASHNRSMFVGAFKQAVFFRSKEGWFG